MVDVADQKIVAVQDADVVSDSEGRQYHINLAPGELAEYVIMVGDPQRSVRASRLLENIRVEKKNREFYTYTGMYKGLEVSIMSTGIGPSNTEIALIESYQIAKNPAFIRVGTCGSLQENIKLGDLVISSGGVRLEDTSSYFVFDGYPAVANYEAVLALIRTCERNKYNYHVGVTASASGFYGAQGRHIPGVHLRYPNLQEELSDMNVCNFEMEAATLFTISTMIGLRASAVCLAIAERKSGAFIDPDGKTEGEKNCIIAGLDGLVMLSEMDKQKEKADKKYWTPDL